MSDRLVPSRQQFFVSCANGLLFSATFIISCIAIGRSLPFPDVPVVRSKLAHFAAHRDEYDTLFLGSSHFYYQIIPSLFDGVAAENGYPTRSFNAGIAGMRPPEDGYLLERFLSLSPRNLRHVFIELAILRTRVENAGSRRAVYWHDWRRMQMIWRSATAQLRKKSFKDGVEPTGEWLSEVLTHLLLFLQRATNLGRGEIITARLGGSRFVQNPAADLGAALDGWIPSNRPETMQSEMLSRYQRDLAERERRPARKYEGDRVSQQALSQVIADIEKAGAVPVLVVPPTTDSKNFRPAPVGSRAIVLDFCDLERFPELFEPSHRLDLTHVNTAGAQVFTRLLARRFVEESAQRR